MIYNLRSLFWSNMEFRFSCCIVEPQISFQTRWSVRSKGVASKPYQMSIRAFKPSGSPGRSNAMSKSKHQNITSSRCFCWMDSRVLGNMARALRYIQPTCLHSLFSEELLQLVDEKWWKLKVVSLVRPKTCWLTVSHLHLIHSLHRNPAIGPALKLKFQCLHGEVPGSNGIHTQPKENCRNGYKAQHQYIGQSLS